MTPYKPMYYCLFNAVTDAISQLERGQTTAALSILRSAQAASEDIYLDSDQEDPTDF